MTSRDELLRLAERLEAAAGGNECSLWAEAATVLREMLEQKPVAYVRRLDEPSPHCITDMKYRAWKDAEDGVQYQQLYAAPVPAVDLEAFKQEAIRLYDEATESADTRVHVENWHALQAHLDKLGGT